MQDSRIEQAAALCASRRSAVAPFLAMDVLRDARRLEAEGRHILHLEVGQPGAPAPEGVRRAAAEALEQGAIGYTEALGIRPLRERIARHYAEAYDLDLSPDRVVVTTGSSAGFVLAFLTCFDAGARIALAAPGYPAYSNILAALALEVAWLETTAATRWAPTPEMLESSSAEGILVASPANPSGTVIAPEALGALVAAAAERGTWFISDEIYHGLTYGVAAETALRYSDDAIIINSFSKYYCMTGWRIGWMVVPERWCARWSGWPRISTSRPRRCRSMRRWRRSTAPMNWNVTRRSMPRTATLLRKALPRDRPGPRAADGRCLLRLCDVTRFTNDSRALAARMLHEAGVATTPGIDFDPIRGSQYLRLSFAGATDEIAEAVKRMGQWLVG
jgi:aspartate/methionine/tyrosine aminotransferase